MLLHYLKRTAEVLVAWEIGDSAMWWKLDLACLDALKVDSEAALETASGAEIHKTRHTILQLTPNS